MNATKQAIKNMIYGLAVMAIILLCINNAFADINIIPDRHIVSVPPGQQEVVMYHVNNTGDEDINIIIEPKSWSGPRSPYEWLDLESDNIYVNAGGATPLIVNVSVPDDATGEMVAMLFLCYKDSTESQLNIRNGVPLYLIAEGTETYDLEIKDIDVSYARKGYFHDLGFTVKIKNTGNVHIVPDVRVIVQNQDGRTVKDLFLQRPNIVLRNIDHVYNLGWREPDLRDGIYKAIAVLDYEDRIAPRTKEILFQVAGNRIEKIETTEAGD
jgi:hypothetical protein